MIKTKSEIKTMAAIISEAVWRSGDDGIASGHLYAMLMQYVELGLYEGIVDLLIESDLIKRSDHVLSAKPKLNQFMEMKGSER